MSYDEPDYGQLVCESVDDLYEPLAGINDKLDVMIGLLKELAEKERGDERGEPKVGG